MNDFIASILNKFKTDNPKLFGVIALLLTGIFAILNSPDFVSTFGSPEWLTTALKYTAFVLALVSGSHTAHLTNKGQVKK